MSPSLARKGAITANLKRNCAQHNSRKPTVRNLGTETACAMQVTRPEQGLMLHPKACAAFGLDGGLRVTQAPQNPSTKTTPLACLGSGIRQEVQRNPRVLLTGQDVCKHGGTAYRLDAFVMPAANSSSGVARGCGVRKRTSCRPQPGVTRHGQKPKPEQARHGL